MSSVKVSICIPAYRQTEFLKKALQSVQLQTYGHYELIVTDDSPDDAVKKLIDTFDFEGKLRYFKNTRPLGSPENWNESIRRASGEYIKILHHDDWFATASALDEFVKLLDEHPDADFAFSASSVFYSESGKYILYSPSQQQLKQLKAMPSRLFLGNCIGAPSSTIYRRSLTLFFDTKIKYVVDIDFYIRALQRNKNFAFTENALVCIANHSGQVTNACLSKEVQLYEYAYLYSKLNKGRWPSIRHIRFFKNLFLKYEVTSLNEFKTIHVSPPAPAFIFKFVLFCLNCKRILRGVLKRIHSL